MERQRTQSYKFESNTGFWFIPVGDKVNLGGKWYRPWERYDSSGDNWILAGKALIPTRATKEQVIQAFLD